jgi:hypothetical protein
LIIGSSALNASTNVVQISRYNLRVAWRTVYLRRRHEAFKSTLI